MFTCVHEWGTLSFRKYVYNEDLRENTGLIIALEALHYYMTNTTESV